MAENTIDPSKQHGAFSWNELMTTDLDAAKSFYQSMFNWQFEDLQMQEPYSIAKINGQEVSGLMSIPPEAEGMPPMWGGYITVDDVEKSVKQAVSLGGSILLEPKYSRGRNVCCDCGSARRCFFYYDLCTRII